MNLSKLYDRASDGSTKEWHIDALTIEGGEVVIRTSHGKLGGKITVTDKVISVGKNIGRANETTPLEQAESEARSTWQKKKDKGYVENLDNAESKEAEELPMLAHTFTKRGHDIKYPAFGQKKLNGVRCFAKKMDDTTIRYTSRLGKPITTVGHLTKDLLRVMSVGQIFDGELYVHDWTFQRIISAVKKDKGDSKNLEFWVYDTIIQIHPEAHYSTRYLHLIKLFDSGIGRLKDTNLVLVESYTLPDKGYVKTFHDDFVAGGFEGIIIRNGDGAYAMKHRSKNLQKYKSFLDEEFEIIGGKEGAGSDAGCVVFQVRTLSGETFHVRPKGTVQHRRQLMKELPSLLGKKLTVRFQELSESGIPIFPVGISVEAHVRDYE